MANVTFCLIQTCALISNSLFHSYELNCDIFASSQYTMSDKHGSNETNIALIYVEKLYKFQLKWVIYMSKNIFCLIKTSAQIQKALNTALNFLTVLVAVNARC